MSLFCVLILYDYRFNRLWGKTGYGAKYINRVVSIVHSTSAISIQNCVVLLTGWRQFVPRYKGEHARRRPSSRVREAAPPTTPSAVRLPRSIIHLPPPPVAVAGSLPTPPSRLDFGCASPTASPELCATAAMPAQCSALRARLGLRVMGYGLRF